MSLELAGPIHYAPGMFRSGYMAIVGLPNVGKSTLLNQLLGEKLAIVTKKPQTTRHRILGILNRPQAQIMLMDTPGIHDSKKLLNEQLVQVARNAMPDADVILHLIFPRGDLRPEDEAIAEQARRLKKPYLVAINQVDRVAKESLLPLMEQVMKRLKPQEVIPISALQGDGTEKIIELVEARLPEGPAYYPKDLYTEHDLRFLCSELVREKAMALLQQELPYFLTVQVENFKEEENVTHLQMAIIVERPSQKKIVIGRGGQMIKRIGMQARKEIQTLLGRKVFLELFVKVVEGWTENKNRLKEFGITP